MITEKTKLKFYILYFVKMYTREIDAIGKKSYGKEKSANLCADSKLQFRQPTAAEDQFKTI